MVDYGIKISQEHVDANKATLSQLLLSSQYPFSKIDTQNPSGFITVNFQFLNEIPGTLGAITTTKIYSLPHNYTYIPQYWATCNVLVPATNIYLADNTPNYIKAATVVDYVLLFFRATIMTIDVYVQQSSSGIVPLSDIAVKDTIMQLGFYVFVDNV